MKKNVAAQLVGAQMIAVDGSDFAGSVTVYVTTNGSYAIGATGGGACALKGNGYYEYTPTAGETNGDHIAFTFNAVGAISSTVQVYPGFPQSVDNATNIANIQSRLPASLSGGNMKSDLTAIGASTTALTAFKSAVQGNVIGTVGTASTSSSIVTSSVTPAASVIDQLKGRILTFRDDTTTAALRGQSTDITASTGSANPVLTVTTLTTAPVSGDAFTIT